MDDDDYYFQISPLRLYFSVYKTPRDPFLLPAPPLFGETSANCTSTASPSSSGDTAPDRDTQQPQDPDNKEAVRDSIRKIMSRRSRAFKYHPGGTVYTSAARRRTDICISHSRAADGDKAFYIRGSGELHRDIGNVRTSGPLHPGLGNVRVKQEKPDSPPLRSSSVSSDNSSIRSLKVSIPRYMIRDLCPSCPHDQSSACSSSGSGYTSRSSSKRSSSDPYDFDESEEEEEVPKVTMPLVKRRYSDSSWSSG